MATQNAMCPKIDLKLAILLNWKKSPEISWLESRFTVIQQIKNPLSGICQLEISRF